MLQIEIIEIIGAARFQLALNNFLIDKGKAVRSVDYFVNMNNTPLPMFYAIVTYKA